MLVREVSEGIYIMKVGREKWTKFISSRRGKILINMMENIVRDLIAYIY